MAKEIKYGIEARTALEAGVNIESRADRRIQERRPSDAFARRRLVYRDRESAA